MTKNIDCEEKYWQKKIKEQRDSGKTITQWCAENKITRCIFFQWKAKLGFTKTENRGRKPQINKAILKRLKKTRQMKNISTQEIDEMLWAPEGTYAEMEKGSLNMTLAEIDIIIETLGITREYFFEGIAIQNDEIFFYKKYNERISEALKNKYP
ncbi:MAG: hypothetical protein ACFFG0_04235 [Candidatus Thorarchaeota archaeon]